MKNKHILAVDDETDILELLSYNLEKERFSVSQASTGEKALDKAREKIPDLILLDLMLPGIDGLDVCRLLKNNDSTSGIPVIMLTAKGEENDIVIGLELGADDYITKPFSPRVLIARIKTVLKRKMKNRSISDNVIVIDNFRINILKHHVSIDNEPVELTTTEFGILTFLIKRPGWVFTRSQIIQNVKGDDYYVTDRSVDVQILNLRRKLKNISEYIETVRGVGYKFREFNT